MFFAVLARNGLNNFHAKFDKKWLTFSFLNFKNTPPSALGRILSFTNRVQQSWSAFLDFKNTPPSSLGGILSSTNRVQRSWSAFLNFKNGAPQSLGGILSFMNMAQRRFCSILKITNAILAYICRFSDFCRDGACLLFTEYIIIVYLFISGSAILERKFENLTDKFSLYNSLIVAK